ncbi:hypothetical protein TI39_contig5896g00003 [Zymoseptoria brevis]|uniref:Zn(2)-C6 fungal-type domain-containing protein n=1 Tax=Zymoseptoria brevis TaxID=1047168 RepID=A0A0F4G4F7_9PEZI|nr:hypothetical protein TI39_contig5896g00003 [Zymoseptoria brevis]
MAHNGYPPHGLPTSHQGTYYPTTPPRHPMYTYNHFAGQDLTPAYEYEGFTFGQPAVQLSTRALSEPFVFQANCSPQSALFEDPQPRLETPRSQHASSHKTPAVPISPSLTTPRVKAKRTPTACEECRKKKQKCDGEQPCQACKEQNIDCQYREVPPTKKDHSLEKLAELMENFSYQLVSLSRRIDTMGMQLKQNEERMTMLPTSCWHCGSGLQCPN